MRIFKLTNQTIPSLCHRKGAGKQTPLTLSQMKNFRHFQTETVCRDHLKFDENGRQFFKWVGNTVRWEEIACYEQFLLFQYVFKRLVLQTPKH